MAVYRLETKWISVSAKSYALWKTQKPVCGDRRANFLIASSKLSVARPKICLFLLPCSRLSSPPLHCRPKLGRRQKAASLSVLLLCARACPSSPIAFVCAMRDIFVCKVAASGKQFSLLRPENRSRERHLHLCHSHTRSWFIFARFSLSSRLSQIVKQVASPLFVFSSSRSALEFSCSPF